MKEVLKKIYALVLAFALVISIMQCACFSAKAAKPQDGEVMYVSARAVKLYDSRNIYGEYEEIPYLEKVILLDIAYENMEGQWLLVLHNDKEKYMFVPDGEEYLMEKLPKSAFHGNTKYQQEAMDIVKDILYNWKTRYAHKESRGVPDENGVYGFDCSGLCSYVMNTVMQKYKPSYYLSTSIVTMYNKGKMYSDYIDGEFKTKIISVGKLDESKLQPGDVLFFNLATEEGGTTHERGYNHCGIYIGNGQMVHSTHALGGGVKIMPLNGIYKKRYVRAKRYLPERILSVDMKKYNDLSIEEWYDAIVKDEKL